MSASLETIPGEWICPKCSYFESRRILSAVDGSVGINPTPALPCPNDGEFMVPLTWKQHALDLRKMIDGFLERQLTREDASYILGLKVAFMTEGPSDELRAKLHRIAEGK